MASVTMDTVIRASRLITPDDDLSPGWVGVRGGQIEAVGLGAGPADVPAVELGPLTLVPGFVDVHVHGGGGFSLMTRREEDVLRYARWVPATGVTSFLATICADSVEIGRECLDLVTGLDSAGAPGAEILGVNLEGPFVSPDRLGALPGSWAIPPDLDVFGGFLAAARGKLRLMTIAPELQGAGEVIDAAIRSGVRVSVGHSDAGFDDASGAFAAGASHVTHAFNAMRPLHHRDPGVIGAALQADDVTVEIIADGVHLHPATIEMLVRAFGPSRVALVTDAVAPAGLDAGSFRIGGREARLDGGRIKLPDGTIAGSAATMDGLLRNVVEWGCAPLADAVRMLSAVPAAIAGCGDCKGRIAAGYDADLVALTPGLEVACAWVRGEQVFRAA